MTKYWTDDEIKILTDNYTTHTDKEIAEMLNRPCSGVKSKRQELGLEKDKAHRKYTFQDVINEFTKRNYILLSGEEDYINAAENSLKYLCPKHIQYGSQSISLGHLQSGRGCYYCGRETTEKAHIIPNEKLDQICKDLCNKKGFIYIGFFRKDGRIYIQYICPNHKECGVQEMQKGNMERDNITACPFCVENKNYKFSKGEQEIENYLIDNNIVYTRQYIFSDCIDQRYLPFDFYLNELNKCVEYDGQHHFYPVTFNGISIEEATINHANTVRHDNIKTEYCKKNNIPLLRIPYFEQNDIKNKLNNFIFNKGG